MKRVDRTRSGDTGGMEAVLYLALAVLFFAVAGYQFSRRRS
jgi:hypothetical protein